jgi:hypothetical protein
MRFLIKNHCPWDNEHEADSSLRTIAEATKSSDILNLSRNRPVRDIQVKRKRARRSARSPEQSCASTPPSKSCGGTEDPMRRLVFRRPRKYSTPRRFTVVELPTKAAISSTQIKKALRKFQQLNSRPSRNREQRPLKGLLPAKLCPVCT